MEIFIVSKKDKEVILVIEVISVCGKYKLACALCT